VFLCLLAALSVSMLNVRTALSQVPADFNGDGGVDGADLPLFAACMGGPNSSPSAACAQPFIIDVIDFIGITKAIKMQAAAARKAGCLPWSSPAATRRFPRPFGSRGYVVISAFYPSASLYGAGALIDGQHRPVLCGIPAGTATAFSLRWACLIGPAPSSTRRIWWLQSGVATYRRWGNPIPAPTTLVRTHPYAERMGKTGVWKLQIDGTFTPTAAHDYQVHWSSSPRTATFLRDGLSWYSDVLDLPTEPGDRVQYAGETLNTADRMAGGPSNPCKIRECKWEAGAPGNWLPVEFYPTDLSVTPFYLYGGQVVGTDGIDMWDW